MKYAPFGLFCFILISTTLGESPLVLDPIEVVAAPLPPVLTGNVTVLKVEDLRRRGNPPFVFENLRDESGVNVVQHGGVGGLTTVSVRGLGGNHTLITLFNIPLNTSASQGNQALYTLFPSQFLNSMEIQRGVAGVLYGSSAMGGVVALNPKIGPEAAGSQTEIVTEGGSFGSLKTGLSHAIRTKEAAFYGGYSHFQTDGLPYTTPQKYGERNRFFQESVLLSGEVKPSQTMEVQAFVYGVQHRLHGDARPLSGAKSVINLTDVLVGTQATVTPLSGNTVHRMQVAHHTLKTRSLGGRYHQSAYVNHGRYGVDWQARQDQMITLGGQVDQEHLDDHKELDKSLANPAVFMTHKGQWGRIETHLGGRYYHHQKFGSQGVYTAGMSLGHRLLDSWDGQVFTNVGTGFRPPSLMDLYGKSAFALPNPTLKPERNIMGDLGVQVQWDPVTLRLAYFVNRSRNLIRPIFTQGKYFPINVDKTNVQGLEGTFKVQVDRWDIIANYTYTRARDQRTHAPVMRLPQHQISGQVGYKILPAWSVFLDIFGVTKRLDTVERTRVLMKPYRVVNISTTYRFDERGEIFVRLENALNRSYEMAHNYATTPRSLQGGLRWIL